MNWTYNRDFQISSTWKKEIENIKKTDVSFNLSKSKHWFSFLQF